MNNQEALEKLELEVGASQQTIKQQYQEFYNEFQMRITNAPTTHQKTLYQRKLKELEDAYNLLTGQNSASLDDDIPWSSPGDLGSTPGGNKPPEKKKETLTKTKALDVLGLNEPFTSSALDTSFNTKKVECEKGIQQAPTEPIKQAYKKALQEVVAAYQLLITFAKEEKEAAFTPPPKEPKHQKQPENTTPSKKLNPLTYIIPAVIIIGIALFFWKPWAVKIDSVVLERYLKLVVAADSAYYGGVEELALEKYQAAYKLMSTQNNKKIDKWLKERGVEDSIASITTLILERENAAWDSALIENNQKLFEEYLFKYSNGKYRDLAATKVDSFKIDSIKKEKAKRVVIPKSQMISIAKKAMIKRVESDQQTRVDLQKFLGMHADLTLHKLAIAMYRHLDDPGQYRFEAQVLTIANDLNNQNSDFIKKRTAFENSPLSRYHLSKLLPYLVDAINNQINVSGDFKKQSIFLDKNDLEIMELIGEFEIRFDTGRYDDRFIANHNSQRSILNLARIINDSIANSRGLNGDITNDMWNRLQDINTEIVNHLDATKLPNGHRSLYNSYRVKNGSQALLKGEYLSLLFKVSNSASGFNRGRYLKYGEAELITRQSTTLVNLKIK
jgi:hypothetical protein